LRLELESLDSSKSKKSNPILPSAFKKKQTPKRAQEKSPDIDLVSEEEESAESTGDEGNTTKETKAEPDSPPKKGKIKVPVPGKGKSSRGGKSVVSRK
jgi:hypothetical protein